MFCLRILLDFLCRCSLYGALLFKDPKHKSRIGCFFLEANTLLQNLYYVLKHRRRKAQDEFFSRNFGDFLDLSSHLAILLSELPCRLPLPSDSFLPGCEEMIRPEREECSACSKSHLTSATRQQHPLIAEPRPCHDELPMSVVFGVKFLLFGPPELRVIIKSKAKTNTEFRLPSPRRSETREPE